MTPEHLAKRLNEAECRLAPKYGFGTSTVPWDRLTIGRRSLLVATAEEVMRSCPNLGTVTEEEDGTLP